MHKKIISLCLTIILSLISIPVTSLAASVGSDAAHPDVGEDVIQEVKTQYSQLEVNDTQTGVYLTVDDSNLVVSLPTTIIVSGTPDSSGKYTGRYSVGVSGDISGDKHIKIEPEGGNVVLKQKGKNDKLGTISQQQTQFGSSDFKNSVVTTGSVFADKLTAGNWNGKFNFNVSYETDDKQFDGYTVLYRYDLSETSRDQVYAYYLVPNENTLAVHSDGSLREKTGNSTKTSARSSEIEHNGIKYTLSDDDKLVITGEGTVKSNIINDLGDQDAIQNVVEKHFSDKYSTTAIEMPTNEEWNSMSVSEKQSLRWYKWNWKDGGPRLTEYCYQLFYRDSNTSSNWHPSLYSTGNVSSSLYKLGLYTRTIAGNAIHNDTYSEIMTYKNSIASAYSISCPKTVTLSENITKIGDKSFAGMTSLENIELPNSLQEIGNNAFQGCINLKGIDFPENLRKIGSSAFLGCTSIRNIELPESLTALGYACFENCTNLIRFDFNNCNITEIPSRLLKNTKIYSVTVPDSVTTIGASSLYEVKHVEIPNGVSRIDSYALYNADDVYLPASVESLGSNALRNAATVYVSNENTTFDTNSIVGNKNGNIYCYSQELADKVNSIKRVLTTDQKNNLSPSFVASEKFSLDCKTGNHNYIVTQYGKCIDLRNVSGLSDIKDDNVKIYTCQDCGHRKYELNPDFHEYELSIMHDATCTDPGNGISTCRYCHNQITPYIPPTGHQFVDGVCTKCGESSDNS